MRRGLLLAALLGLAVPAAAQTQDPSFRLVNRSTTTIEQIYVSSSAVSTWGEDRLGSSVLTAGNSIVIRMPMGQCVNDVLVIYDNGRQEERRNVNTCNIMEMSFP